MLQFLDMEQGSPEWHLLRKNKITATDASVIMGASHWKTKVQLYHEKISTIVNTFKNDAMQRGIDLEPIARDLFNVKTGLNMKPIVLINDWMMASLDGRDEKTKSILEIKCPGDKDHSLALQGKVPDHYYPQLQHQICIAEVQIAYYFSFDGADGVIIEVKRDDEYIEKMLSEELKFYECLINNIPPEPSPDHYLERNDDVWNECVSRWRSISDSIKDLEKEEEEIRKQLIFLSGESNTKGAGISLCQIQRKGNIDYSKIPQLKGLDLEIYRKPSTASWRITCG